MTATTWSHLAGDTREFALEVSFHPDSESEAVSPDLQASWGSFALYVHGKNLCSQSYEGETLERVHWYLLPLFEWFVEHWDAIFHEERFPEPVEALSAADFDSWAQGAPLEADQPSWGRLEAWQAWLERHHLAQGAAGGLFPDVYLRRLRDQLEVSVGAAAPVGSPPNWSFVHRREVDCVPVGAAANAVHEVIRLATSFLADAAGDSDRIEELADRVKGLRRSTPSAFRERLLWMVGADDAFQIVEETAAKPLTTAPQGALVIGSPPATALLFGSYAPSVEAADLKQLRDLLVGGARSAGTADTIDELRAELFAAVETAHADKPGEEGGSYGDALFALVVKDAQSLKPVPVNAVLADAQVRAVTVHLRDPMLRGLSIVGEGHAPLIAVNTGYFRGDTPAVQRFTMAHELGHLLLDAHRAREWGLASGPWAPLGVEQRANGFAAALLMPEAVLRSFAQQADEEIANPKFLRHLARSLEVSVTSLVDRLRNIGLLDGFRADQLKDELTRS